MNVCTLHCRFFPDSLKTTSRFKSVIIVRIRVKSKV